MKTHFLALDPKHGKYKNRPTMVEIWNSPYFWWWFYLSENSDYIKCCKNNGKGKLSELYKDFGDVRNREFDRWWNEKINDNGKEIRRGNYLFAEEMTDIEVKKLNNASEWENSWKNEDVIVLAVNLQVDKPKLKKMLIKLLNEEHKGKKGRIALSKAKSTAKYPIYRNFSSHNLEKMLGVFIFWNKNKLKPKSKQMKLWEIGEMMNLVPSAMPNKYDVKSDITYKRNTMTATVRRHIKKAQNIIANTAKGEFPNSNNP